MIISIVDVYETGLVVQRPPLRAAESEKTMDNNTTQDKQAFYRELQGRRVFIPCRKQGDENITLETFGQQSGRADDTGFLCKRVGKGEV